MLKSIPANNAFSSLKTITNDARKAKSARVLQLLHWFHYHSCIGMETNYLYVPCLYGLVWAEVASCCCIETEAPPDLCGSFSAIPVSRLCTDITRMCCTVDYCGKQFRKGWETHSKQNAASKLQPSLACGIFRLTGTMLYWLAEMAREMIGETDLDKWEPCSLCLPFRFWDFSNSFS